MRRLMSILTLVGMWTADGTEQATFTEQGIFIDEDTVVLRIAMGDS